MGVGQRPVYLGLDLGTTNSTAAVFDGDRLSLVRNGEGSTLTPSVVRVSARGQIIVGAKARRALDSDPENTKAEFKRLMGTREPIGFRAAGLSKRPEELSALVLGSLREDVRAQLGFLPERAVISVPALFELPQSAATSEAARLAGFTQVELIQEPIASALAAGWNAEAGSGLWLVYDLGGGTFDVSLLETRDGLLRVVGHDGDNFLGGRDLDWAIVDWALGRIREQEGVELSRARPEHAALVRKLKYAAEEAKIALSRAERAELALEGALELDGRALSPDLTLDRATLAALATPLLSRSLAVCRRLLGAQGVKAEQLARVVLVGGPTVMPLCRQMVADGLGAPLADGSGPAGQGLDPMTLVAQGAAIYAATAGLEARPAAPARTAPRRFWLHHPAMSSDLSPHVLGRLVEGGEGPEVAAVSLVRADGQWDSGVVPLDKERAFITTVSLLPRRPNVFRLEARAADGTAIAADPPTLTIVQGLTIGDPPLSRTIGVALADDQVRVYFERGAPLPAKRSFVHQTVEAVAKGSAESLVKIPIVQGELEQAHLCRLVGTLEIGGRAVSGHLPAGSAVEITLELDRGGRLSARALVPALDQVFEEVAHLLVPEASPAVLAAGLDATTARLSRLRADSFRAGRADSVRRLGELAAQLAEAGVDVAAAQGGDADAGQKARRSLLELEAELDALELAGRWPELEQEAVHELAAGAGMVAMHGSATEQRLYGEVSAAVERARKAKDAVELGRQLRVARNLANAAYYRHPEAWRWMFEAAASEAHNATPLLEAEQLVRRGRAAAERNDKDELRQVTERLWKLLPADAESRCKAFDSGVR